MAGWRKGREICMFAPDVACEYASDGADEDNLQQAIAELHIDEFLDIIKNEIRRRQMGRWALTAYLMHKIESIKLYERIEALWAKASYDLHILRDTYSSCFREDDGFPWFSTDHGDGGVGDGRGSTMYRVLVPLSFALQLFQHADIKHFMDKGTARLPVDQYSRLEDLRMARMNLWKDWCTGSANWELVSCEPYCGLEVTALQLGLDYTNWDIRYKFRKPPNEEVGQKVLRKWAEVLESAKFAQMQVEDKYCWPPKCLRPWDIKELKNMPVLLWVQEELKKC